MRRAEALPRAALALLAVLAASPLVACGGPASPARTEVAVDVRVSFDRAVDPLPFDPRGARLSSALRRLEELAGHAVTFRLDAALLPDHQGAFEEMLIEAVEHAAQELLSLSERDRGAFDRTSRLLERIECRYDAALREPDAVFDSARRTLLVKVPPGASALLPRGAVYSSLDDEHARYREARYGQAEPRAIPDAELEDYVRFLTGYRPHAPRRPASDHPDSIRSDPKGGEVLRLLAVLPRVRGEVAARVIKELVEAADHFGRTAVQHAALVEAAPRDSVFFRARAEWLAWVVPALPRLAPAERRAVLEALFARSFNDDVERYGRYSRLAFPGVDRIALSLAVVDEWRLAGYPVDVPGDRERGRLFEEIVCPYPVNADGGRSRAPRCDHHLYRYALSEPGGLARLAGAVLDRRDPYFTEAVAVNVAREGDVSSVLELWRAVERDEATWRVVGRVIAEEVAEASGDAALVDEARRLYRAYPARRGLLLYLLAALDRYGHGKVPWATFGASFGASVGQHELGAYLGEGPRALSNLAVVWPALAPGFSRAAVIAPKLGAYLDDPQVPRYQTMDPWRSLRELVNHLCGERRRDDLAVLHATFTARAAERPSDARPLANLIEDTAPGACR